MKNALPLVLASGIGLVGAARRAAAQTPPPPPVQPAYGNYCGAATTDGNWAFTWNWSNVYAACNAVRTYLNRTTSAPLIGSQSGYFRTSDWNTVVMQCSNGRQSFAGNGVAPLQQAYNYANAVNGRSCLFQVY